MKENTTYLVMEVHTAYAVLLNNEGRFIKAANAGYQIGDVVEKAFPLKYPEDRKKQAARIIRFAAGLAACICVAVFGVYEYQYFFLPYGTLQMQINPDVEMTLSRSGRVLDLDGINEDGETLIDGYKYDGKDKYTVTDELTDRAINLGFLGDGGQVALLVSSQNAEWAESLEKDLIDEPVPAPEPSVEPEPVQPAANDSGYGDDASDDLYDDDSAGSPSGGDSSYGDGSYGDSSYGDDGSDDDNDDDNGWDDDIDD